MFGQPGWLASRHPPFCSAKVRGAPPISARQYECPPHHLLVRGVPNLGAWLAEKGGYPFFVKARGQFYYKMGRPALLLEYVVTPRASNEN